VETNYDTDLMLPIIRRTEELCERKMTDSAEDAVAMKVIADHSRAAAFLINDGVLPSNEWRGYVLRRIMRRAIRYGRKLGLTEPFLHETASVVFDIMKPAYPDLSESSNFITNVINNEETRFSKTLDIGLRLLNETLAELRQKGEETIPGDIIFKLYDTYGFPVDIVRDVVRDDRMTLDMEGYESAMKVQQAQSSSDTSFIEISDAYKHLSAEGVKLEFVGYDQDMSQSKVLLLVSEGNEVESAGQGMAVEIVTESTAFYGEAGGQVGDIGKITAQNNGDTFEMVVKDTVKDPTGLIIHKGEIVSGNVQKGDTVTLAIDKNNREAIALNHTATHILHYALRKVLGDHIKQAGSLVAPDRLRFDFTHFSQVDAKELDEIERIVNERIRENVAVDVDEMEAEEAFQSGATALFEEKYGDRVRVISLSDFSRELCGGTHTERTGNIGLFKIISESSVASGVRRIEALTGPSAMAYVQQTTHRLQEAARMLKENPESLTPRIRKMMELLKSAEKEIELLKTRLLSSSLDKVEDEVKELNGLKIITKQVNAENPAALRELADRLKDKIGSGIVVLGSQTNGKVLLIAAVTKDLTARYHAGKIIKQVASVVGGSGGGRPDMAQAGGTQPENLEKAIQKVFEIISDNGE
jgi:alanyl-tRNA synthetase